MTQPYFPIAVPTAVPRAANAVSPFGTRNLDSARITTADLKQNERADVAGILFRDAQEVQTAQGINYSLRCLYWLAAKNRVSPRRAKVLAYICGLLLRTLPLIAEERRAGITWVPNPPEPDPTKKPS